MFKKQSKWEYTSTMEDKMLDKKFKKLCEKIDLKKYRVLNRMQYIMNYGEYTICYEFFLN